MSERTKRYEAREMEIARLYGPGSAQARQAAQDAQESREEDRRMAAAALPRSAKIAKLNAAYEANIRGTSYRDGRGRLEGRPEVKETFTQPGEYYTTTDHAHAHANPSHHVGSCSEADRAGVELHRHRVRRFKPGYASASAPTRAELARERRG